MIDTKKLDRLITEVHEEHIARLDIPEGDLEPRPRRKKKPPRTSILSEVALKAYRDRMRNKVVLTPEELEKEAMDQLDKVAK